jgi:hypothetical protein
MLSFKLFYELPISSKEWMMPNNIEGSAVISGIMKALKTEEKGREE